MAATIFERVRTVDPSNEMASLRLEAIYRAQYKWEPLCEVLLERVEMTDDLEARIQTLQKVAKVYEEEIGDQERARHAANL